MNKDRYLKALAEEVKDSVDALFSEAPEAAGPVQRPVERVAERRAAPRDINTVIKKHRSHAALFPGVSPTISRFDIDD